MKLRLLDVLACPMCKNFPLKLTMITEREDVGRGVEEVPCELFCGYHQAFISTLERDRLIKDCNICMKRTIVHGVLFCEKCGRWYPIIDEIPRMMPDDLRERKEELKFLKENAEAIPERILKEGKPFHL